MLLRWCASRCVCVCVLCVCLCVCLSNVDLSTKQSTTVQFILTGRASRALDNEYKYRSDQLMNTNDRTARRGCLRRASSQKPPNRLQGSGLNRLMWGGRRETEHRLCQILSPNSSKMVTSVAFSLSCSLALWVENVLRKEADANENKRQEDARRPRILAWCASRFFPTPLRRSVPR